MNKVYVLILNYNGWADTIECLESVLRNQYPLYQVVVVDNNSPDNSVEYIKSWAEGKLDVYVGSSPLRYLSSPPIPKPIPYLYYTREVAEKGGTLKSENTTENSENTGFPLVIIQSGDNLGFSGGNNVGIRYALAKDDFDFIWLLNNDTVIEKKTLSSIVEQAVRYKNDRVKKGIIGSKLLYYDSPGTIHGVGGRYNKWFAVSRQIGILEKDGGQYDRERIDMDYVIGASALISRDFIKDVGLMSEDYFLYFEELDLATRGRRKGWDIGYCWRSVVYHKEGGSIGSDYRGQKRSELADYYGLKNRIVFTKKFFPSYLWSVYLGFTIAIFNRIRRKQFDRVALIFKLLWRGLFK